VASLAFGVWYVALVREAHQVCPYPNAIGGIVDIDLLLRGEPI